MRLRTPLGKARGLGSAKEGVHHWWAQRLTAIALVPLTLWFTIELVTMSTVDYQSVVSWMQSPLVALIMILFILALFYHAQLGIQVVVEDYIGNKAIRVGSIILLKFVMLFAGLASVISVLKVFLGF